MKTKTNARHRLTKSFVMTMGLLACALDQSALALELGTDNVATNVDLSASSLMDTSLTVVSTLASVTNTVTIGADQNLTINGPVMVGTNVASSTTVLNMMGAGSFVVDKSGGTMQIGGAASGTAFASSTLDMGQLATFTASLGQAGTMKVGGASNSGYVSPATTMVLATNSTITAGTIYVGTAERGPKYLKLGSGQNILNATTVSIGTLTSGGSLIFNTGLGAVKIRGFSGDDTDRADFIVSDVNYGVSTGGTADFSGHSTDLMLNQLIIGRRAGGSSGGQVNTGNFIFDTGTVDINTVTLGNMQSAAGNTGYGTTGNMTLNGGTTVINTGMIIATNASAPDAGRYYRAQGTLTVGGTARVVVSNAFGSPAVVIGAMASDASATAVATGTVTVAGGTLTLYNDMVHGPDSTAGTHGGAVLNITGGTLLMPNHAIIGVDKFTMTNGTLAVGVYAGLPVLENRGTGVLAPGGTNVVGSTVISNSYVQASTATLDIDLVSKLSYDRVTVTGAVTLAGTINVRARPAAAGDFDILTSEVSVDDTSTLDAGAIEAGFKKTLADGGKTVRIYRCSGTCIYFR